ncbi:hypothetical protein PV10_07222 [Exophiala mesophila]|uniref:Fe2OG dioxygenase domain-containing protein n=1 Tax=Exophiala mesophila TaxID=212818 RepID=A0A0D1Z7E0_EXOME|nr:uncharacterized protein PV10_07222 [Exophiala mesophila]KIV89854.1 hypothetical protein PV10_07222 [Exophiala mesophila]
MSDPATETVNLPIINISNLTPETGKQVLEAAVRHGFLYVDPTGTKLTQDLVDREFDLSKQFFDLSTLEKQPYRINDNRGWAGMKVEALDPKAQAKGDYKEAFNIGEFDQGRPQQDLPSVLENHREELWEFEVACRETCRRILDLLGIGLEIADTEFFSKCHSSVDETKKCGAAVRMLYYPFVEASSDYQPEVDVRAGAHSDYGSITLLFQRPSQPGLEILKDDGSWAPVAVIPRGYGSDTFPPILVNIGDLLSYWTGGLLKSTVHRVIFPKGAPKDGEPRYSIAYFCQPAEETTLLPVPSRLVQEHKQSQGLAVDGTEGETTGYGYGADHVTKAQTAKEHLWSRLNATYGIRSGA